MTTHVIIRVTADANEPYPKHAAYGPVTRDEAMDIMRASVNLFLDSGLQVSDRHNFRDDWVITAYRHGSLATWKLLLVELRPATDDVCEGIR